MVDAGGALIGLVSTNDTTCSSAMFVANEPTHAQGFGFTFDQSGGAFIYEPESGFLGADSFRYGIGVVDPVFATVTIDVVAIAEPSTTSTTTTTTATTTTTTTMVAPAEPSTTAPPSSQPVSTDPAITTTPTPSTSPTSTSPPSTSTSPRPRPAVSGGRLRATR